MFSNFFAQIETDQRRHRDELERVLADNRSLGDRLRAAHDQVHQRDSVVERCTFELQEVRREAAALLSQKNEATYRLLEVGIVCLCI